MYLIVNVFLNQYRIRNTFKTWQLDLKEVFEYVREYPTVRYLKMRSPPAISANILAPASSTFCFPSTTSSRCMQGQAVESPQFKDHHIVNRNRNTAYAPIPKLSATENTFRTVHSDKKMAIKCLTSLNFKTLTFLFESTFYSWL